MQHLYFIAVIPESPIQQEVTRFKEYAALHFNSRHALRSPAHITLKAPFKYPTDQLPLLKAALRSFAVGREPFELHLQNFDCFAPRVIFINVEPSKALRDLQKDLQLCLSQNAGLPNDTRYPDFHPHMTVAFKDLKKEMFPKAWAYFCKEVYQAKFDVRSIGLLKHEGRKWHLDEAFDWN